MNEAATTTERLSREQARAERRRRAMESAPDENDPLRSTPPEVLAALALSPAWPLRLMETVAQQTRPGEHDLPAAIMGWTEQLFRSDDLAATILRTAGVAAPSFLFGGPLLAIIGAAAGATSHLWAGGNVLTPEQKEAAMGPFKRLVEEGLCQLHETPRGPELVMDEQQRFAVRRFLQSSSPPRDSAWLGRILAQAARTYEVGTKGETHDPAIERWIEFACHAEQLRELTDIIDQKVREAIRDQQAQGRTAAPEAQRWIELAREYTPWFGAPMEAAAVSAARKLELFHRWALDRRLLANYFPRPPQDRALEDLIALPDSDLPGTVWALHYVGAGGMGKTMFLGHLAADLAPAHNLAVARIDFDHLHPDYPSRAPALFLMSLAEELSLHTKGNDEGFRIFERKARELHAVIAAGPRRDLATGGHVLESSEFVTLREAFCGALAEIARRRRPVLVLDTCEELAKLRDGRLPDTVRFTFELLGQIHQAIPAVRVLFCGRRPLAKRGDGWEYTEVTELPERPFLRLHVIRGFTGAEAAGFLEKYRLRPAGSDGDNASADAAEPELGKVAPTLFEPILRESAITAEASLMPYRFNGESEGKDDEERFTPYNLDMFARWSCENRDLREENIRKGIHFYTEERIVRRLERSAPELAAFLPTLALLGRFDRWIAGELLAAPEKFEVLFEELKRQEWISLDRAAAQQESVWAVAPHVRRLLLAYAHDRQPAKWAWACERVGKVMSQVTLNRPWNDVIPAWFDAALRAFRRAPQAGAMWWKKVEQRLADDAEWNQAYEVTAFLLDEDGAAAKPEAEAHVPRRWDSEPDPHPLRAAVMATHASAQMHIEAMGVLTAESAGPKGAKGRRFATTELWREVKATAARHPVAAGQARLNFRARCGILAAWPQTNPNEDWPAGLKQATDDFPGLPELPDAQDFSAGLGALEGVVEAIEHIREEWGDPPELEAVTNFAERFSTSLIELFAKPMGSDGQAMLVFAHSLRARLEASPTEHTFRMSLWFGEAVFQKNAAGSEENPPQRLLGWRRPEGLRARIALEFLRALQFTPDGRQKAAAWMKLPQPALRTLDEDRLAAAVLTVAGYDQVPDWPPEHEFKEAVVRSLALAESTPRCNAQRAFQPYFAALLEAQAEAGRLDAALPRLEAIRREAESRTQLEIVRAVDRVAIRLGVRWHLVEDPAFPFGASLFRSTDVLDLGLQAEWAEHNAEPQQVRDTAARLSLAKNAALGDKRNARAARIGSHLPYLEREKEAVPRRFVPVEVRVADIVSNWVETENSATLGSLELTLGRRGAARALERAALGAMFRRKGKVAERCLRQVNRWRFDLGGDNAAFLLNAAPLALLSLASRDRKAVAGAKQAMGMSRSSPTFSSDFEEFARPQLSNIKPLRLRLDAVHDLEEGWPPNDARQAEAFRSKLSVHFGLRPLPSDLAFVCQRLATQLRALMPWKEIWSVTQSTLAIAVGVAVFGLMFWGWIRLVDWLAVKTIGVALPWYYPPILLLALGALPSVFMALVRLFCLFVRAEIQIRSVRPPADPNRPFQTAVEVRSGATFWPLGWSREFAARESTPITERDYRASPGVVPDFKGYGYLARVTQQPVLEVRLAIDTALAAAPWEAAVCLANGTKKWGETRLLLRRALPGPPRQRPMELRGPLWILTQTGDPHYDAMSGEAWGRVDAAVEFRHQSIVGGVEPAIADRTAIVHLVGRASATVTGLLFSFSRSSSASPLSPVDLIRTYPNLRLCVLQGTIIEQQSAELRREAAAEARRYAAELFAAGAPAVLVIPALPSKIFGKCLELISNLLVETKGQRRPAKVWMQLAWRIQAAIAALATEADPLPEAPYDVCLYMDDLFSLPVSPSVTAPRGRAETA